MIDPFEGYDAIAANLNIAQFRAGQVVQENARVDSSNGKDAALIDIVSNLDTRFRSLAYSAGGREASNGDLDMLRREYGPSMRKVDQTTPSITSRADRSRPMARNKCNTGDTDAQVTSMHRLCDFERLFRINLALHGRSVQMSKVSHFGYPFWSRGAVDETKTAFEQSGSIVSY